MCMHVVAAVGLEVSEEAYLFSSPATMLNMAAWQLQLPLVLRQRNCGSGTFMLLPRFTMLLGQDSASCQDGVQVPLHWHGCSACSQLYMRTVIKVEDSAG